MLDSEILLRLFGGRDFLGECRSPAAELVVDYDRMLVCKCGLLEEAGAGAARSAVEEYDWDSLLVFSVEVIENASAVNRNESFLLTLRPAFAVDWWFRSRLRFCRCLLNRAESAVGSFSLSLVVSSDFVLVSSTWF